jgi:DNA-binding response OmpR family regulator
MKKSHIFIVEDCEMMRQFLTVYLAGSGEVHAFASGSEALDALSLENWPDVIILDLNLPDMHGVDIIRHLQGKQLLGRSKVIVLSGEATASSRIACLSAGAADYVAKPFHPRELKLRIEKIIGTTEISRVA